MTDAAQTESAAQSNSTASAQTTPASTTTPAAPQQPAAPPIAPQKFGTRVRDIHGEHFDDPWDWLRDKENPEVLAHLAAENAWADHICAASADLAAAIESEVRAFTRLADVSVPHRIGSHWYFSRWHEGSNYRTHHRVPAAEADSPPPSPPIDATLPGEELLLDENARAAGHEFYQAVELTPSPDGRLLAWAEDLEGDEYFTWHILDIAAGTIIDSSVCEAGYGVAWAADSSAFIYTRFDAAWRQCELWIHEVGADPQTDSLLLSEADEAFDLWFSPCADPNWVIIQATSTTTGQAWLWSPAYPRVTPVPVTERDPGVLVTAEPAGDHLLIVHTADSVEGTLVAAPLPADLGQRLEQATLAVGTAVAADTGGTLAAPQEPVPTSTTTTATETQETPAGSAPDNPGEKASSGLVDSATLSGYTPGRPAIPCPISEPIAPASTWQTIREAAAGERIFAATAYRDFMVTYLRSDSLTQLEVATRRAPAASQSPGSDLSDLWNPPYRVNVDSPVRTIETAHIEPWDTQSLQIVHQSVTVEPTTEQIDPKTGQRTHLHTATAPGWDSTEYVEERLWVLARDGKTQIPVTLAHHRDVRPDGSNPGWLHGYGSYEISFDAAFETLRLPALRRGVVHAIAHVRGGGELGRAWYEDGKELVKEHSFTDFIDVAQWLVESGWVAPDRLIAEGRSAGGLLMGAVLNQAPQRFRAILAGVPFVDALTTILDPSLPLTVGEWEEWGNPVENPQVYRAMRAYTPYENVPEGVELPAVMATTSLNDTRVFYVEPAKWVQRLRQASGSLRAGEQGANSAHTERPIILRTEMVAGHGGKSGREGRWAARAEEFAFVLRQVGVI
ncbi:MAG: prolyl oligopeptidase family serine peptidase [Actinomycetaceae bacterium]|nr:prolyl oligopeptidase family serine peptidase [Actinomycetaceae bacterium]